MRRCFEHIDLRVRSHSEARLLYEMLLPALGFTRDAKIEGWLQYEVAGTDGAPEFFGVTESPKHVANECRIALAIGYLTKCILETGGELARTDSLSKSTELVEGDCRQTGADLLAANSAW